MEAFSCTGTLGADIRSMRIHAKHTRERSVHCIGVGLGAVWRSCPIAVRAFGSHNGNFKSGEDGESSAGKSAPQEAVLKAISEVSKSEGRIAQTTNVVIGGTLTNTSDDDWKVIDEKVNMYPMVRAFTAIGIGGDDFVQAMVLAVESVLQCSVPEGKVRQKLSSKGKYVSVNIGPVQVESGEQVRAVYDAMRRDDRMKYFL